MDQNILTIIIIIFVVIVVMIIILIVFNINNSSNENNPVNTQNNQTQSKSINESQERELIIATNNLVSYMDDKDILDKDYFVVEYTIRSENLLRLYPITCKRLLEFINMIGIFKYNNILITPDILDLIDKEVSNINEVKINDRLGNTDNSLVSNNEPISEELIDYIKTIINKLKATFEKLNDKLNELPIINFSNNLKVNKDINIVNSTYNFMKINGVILYPKKSMMIKYNEFISPRIVSL